VWPYTKHQNPPQREALEKLQSWRKLEPECAIHCDRKPVESKSYEFSQLPHPPSFSLSAAGSDRLRGPANVCSLEEGIFGTKGKIVEFVVALMKQTNIKGTVKPSSGKNRYFKKH